MQIENYTNADGTPIESMDTPLGSSPVEPGAQDVVDPSQKEASGGASVEGNTGTTTTIAADQSSNPAIENLTLEQ